MGKETNNLYTKLCVLSLFNAVAPRLETVNQPNVKVKLHDVFKNYKITKIKYYNTFVPVCTFGAVPSHSTLLLSQEWQRFPPDCCRFLFLENTTNPPITRRADLTYKILTNNSEFLLSCYLFFCKHKPCNMDSLGHDACNTCLPQHIHPWTWHCLLTILCHTSWSRAFGQGSYILC